MYSELGKQERPSLHGLLVLPALPCRPTPGPFGVSGAERPRKGVARLAYCGTWYVVVALEADVSGLGPGGALARPW